MLIMGVVVQNLENNHPCVKLVLLGKLQFSCINKGSEVSEILWSSGGTMR